MLILYCSAVSKKKFRYSKLFITNVSQINRTNATDVVNVCAINAISFFLVEKNYSNQIMLIVYTMFYVLEQMRFFPFIARYNVYILSALIGCYHIFPVN